MEPLTIVLFVVGLTLLVAGAELLVRGASRIAVTFGVSPLVVGLTIVAFGTSSPEMAVSVSSAYGGSADVAVGNVVGSNIFNVLLILGLSALVAPLVVSQQLVRRDVPLMIGISVLLLVLAMDGQIGRLDGILLFGGVVAYTAAAIIGSRRATRQLQEEYAEEFGEADKSTGSLLYDAGRVVVGLVLLVIGSEWLVDGATQAAEALRVSDLVIGLTLVAAGTSMPELATSIVASIRGERDIAVGNVVGSNIFNILSVLGASSLVAPVAIPVADSAMRVDIPVMIAVALACLPIFFTGWVIARWEGALLIAMYGGYVLYLYLDATDNGALGLFAIATLGFVLPVVAAVLAVLGYRAFREERRNGHRTAA
ncbi:MAG: calcium/sodium antiporter [Dehalococcoidia bacterium]|nr:calcium/sodium antiporter [Dehalococcoidia bacterium]